MTLPTYRQLRRWIQESEVPDRKLDGFLFEVFHGKPADGDDPPPYTSSVDAILKVIQRNDSDGTAWLPDIDRECHACTLQWYVSLGNFALDAIGETSHVSLPHALCVVALDSFEAEAGRDPIDELAERNAPMAAKGVRR